MSLLAYPGLTLADGESLIGLPLGCTPDGLPLQVIAAHPYGRTGSFLEVEEWDPPAIGKTDPAYPPAAQYAWHVRRGEHQPPTAGR